MYPLEKIKQGTWFIDLDKDYDEVKLMFAGNNPKNDDKMSVGWYNFPEEPTIMDAKDFKGKPFPDLQGPWTELFDRYLELRKIYTEAYKPIEQLIYKNQLKKVNVDEILQLYITDYGINIDEAKALLKLSVGKGRLRFERQKGGDFI